MTAIEVTHHAAASRFESTVDGLLCRADYQLVDGVMRMTHTEVPSHWPAAASPPRWWRPPWRTPTRSRGRSSRGARTCAPTCSATPTRRHLLPPGFRL